MTRKSLRRRRRSSKKSKKTTKKKSTRRSENSKIRGGGGVFSSVTRRRNYTPRNPQPINRRVRDLSTRRMNPQSNPQRRARDLRSQDLIRLPEDIILGEIVEMHPLLTPKLTNATITFSKPSEPTLPRNCRQGALGRELKNLVFWPPGSVPSISLDQ